MEKIPKKELHEKLGYGHLYNLSTEELADLIVSLNFELDFCRGVIAELEIPTE